MRRTGLLSALLLTAALLCAMPGLLRSFRDVDDNRMDRQLRPAESRALTLWLSGDGLGDHRLLSALCSAFEKETPGVRVFLRKADVAELDSREAVPPDGLLFLTGDVVAPEDRLLPLSGLEELPEALRLSGASGGVQYAAPLWLAPNVLSLPAAWLAEGRPAPAPGSLFGLQAPATEEGETVLTPETLPWRRMLAEGGLWIKEGVCLPQMLFICPKALRGELIAARPPEATPKKGMARAWSLTEHRTAVKAGESLTVMPLSPAVSGGTRYMAVLRDGEDVRALMRYLTGREAARAAQAAGYLAALPGLDPGDRVLAAVQQAFADGYLIPNAFAHAGLELNALCRDGFTRGVDPVETLLRLR